MDTLCDVKTEGKIMSDTSTFLVSWKIEVLCLFAIRDEVTGEKSSNLKGNYSRHRRLPKYGMLTSFILSLQLQDSLNPSRILGMALEKNPVRNLESCCDVFYDVGNAMDDS